MTDPVPLWTEERDVFGEDFAVALLNDCASSTDRWRRAQTGTPSTHGVSVARNGWAIPAPAWALERLRAHVRERAPKMAAVFGVTLGERLSFEIGATAYHHAGYYAAHTDAGQELEGVADAPVRRRLSFVYYFHALPKRFSGGRLLFPAHGHAYDPVQDSLVWFDARVEHAVELVDVRSPDPRSCRFALQGWVSDSET